MLIFVYDKPGGALVDVRASGADDGGVPSEFWGDGRAVCRTDILAFEQATTIAEAATVLRGTRFLATDSPGTYPRFDVIEAPAIGDACSYAFNGDYYPDGVVARISPDYRIVTSSTGRRYFRRKLRGAWLHKGMWSLVAGRISRLNPEF
jgi:hypothetical protein